MPFKTVDVDIEYQKDKHLRREDVKNLLEWAHKQPHLPVVTELQALLFLHSCYYRIEDAKIALDNYFTARTLCPDLFTPSLDDPLLQLTINKVAMISPLSQKTTDGCTAIYTKLTDYRSENYYLSLRLKFFDMISMLELHQHGTTNGIHVIIDMEGSHVGHMARIHLPSAKKFAFYLQEAMPIRLKAVHIINVLPFAQKVLMIVRPFMKKELVEMLHFHNSTKETLYKYIAKEALPSDCGGQAPSVASLQEEMSKRIVDNFYIFENLQKQRVDESKRSGKPRDEGEIFGLDGNFRKLEFD